MTFKQETNIISCVLYFVPSTSTSSLSALCCFFTISLASPLPTTAGGHMIIKCKQGSQLAAYTDDLQYSVVYQGRITSYVYICTEFYCSEFQSWLEPHCLPILVDEMPGSMTGACGYCACGANVATKACGRERQRGRQGNINRKIK